MIALINVNQSLIRIITSHPYGGVLLLSAVFPPEVIMPIAGYYAKADMFQLIGLVIAAIIGSTLGSYVLYAAARREGVEVATVKLNGKGCWLGVSKRGIARAGRLFDTHARATVFLCRFVPGL